MPSILIDTVRICGFRGIKNLEISLPRVTVLIGTNNSGKTSLLKALQLALGDYSRYVSEEDFYIGSDDKRASEIKVDVRFVAADVNGRRVGIFDTFWQTEFGDKIRAEANGNQFVAIRTCVKPNEIKGGFECSRYSMQTWPEFATWQDGKLKEKINKMISTPFISIEAQRDIHYELKDKSSFAGRVLSGVEYGKEDIIEIERLIQELNLNAINKSSALKSFKTQLEKLNQSFQGAGNVEITPFPKKIRDLSKHFSVHFGEGASNTFSMEYHGMGTRSWASMLTVKTFIEAQAEKHKAEVEPFFPILAAEEPEAHLHPNAQRTLYGQLAESEGQVIVSTHSPYFAAMAKQTEIRQLKRTTDNIEVRFIDPNLNEENSRRLHREIIHSRGEILFSNAIVLCEGETEEQVLPILFQKYFEKDSFVCGVNFVAVGGSGKKYLPFLIFARDLSIPVFIFSDGETKVVCELKKHYEHMFGAINVLACPNITILDNEDFESYLVKCGFKVQVEAAIKANDGVDAIDNWIQKKHGTSEGKTKTSKPPCASCKQEIFSDVLRDYISSGGYDVALVDILSSKKTQYAPLLAAELCKLNAAELPPKIIEFFEKIKKGTAL